MIAAFYRKKHVTLRSDGSTFKRERERKTSNALSENIIYNLLDNTLAQSTIIKCRSKA